MDRQIAKLLTLAAEYDKGDAMRIQHFIKVHDFASTIGVLEGLDEGTMRVLEAAAILHDIGIHVSEEKYGSSAGNYQEIEGPPIAEEILRTLSGYSDEEIERIKYLIGHHHTYTDIDGMDYQILVEADFLVNIYEDDLPPQAVKNAGERIFRTNAGKKLLDDIYQ